MQEQTCFASNQLIVRKMKTALFLSAGALLGTLAQENCPAGYEGRCYCSHASNAQGCDVAARVTHMSKVDETICADFCSTECGEGAGSSFACHVGPLSPCEAKSTTCECSCDYNGTIPIPIQFGSQCSAFCDREDVCGNPGSSFTCSESGAGKLSRKNNGGVVASLAIMAAFSFSIN